MSTKDLKLNFQADGSQTIGYTNSDYVSDPNDKKSTSTYVFMFGGGATSLACKRQKCVSRSTLEVKFERSSLSVVYAIWINGFLANLKLEVITNEPIQLLCDNQAIMYTLKKMVKSILRASKLGYTITLFFTFYIRRN